MTSRTEATATAALAGRGPSTVVRRAVDQDSAAFGLGNLGGSVAMVPLEFNPIGRIYSSSTTGLNAVVDYEQAMTGGSGGDCGAGVAAVGIDVAVGRLGRLGPDELLSGFVRTGDGLAVDLAQNWGNNWHHFGGVLAVTPAQQYTETLALFPTVASDFAISSLGGPQ